MAKNKMRLEVKGFEEYMAKLDEVGGSAAMKRGVEEALVTSKEHINTKLDMIMKPGNMPARGKYWTGKTKSSIDKNMMVEWHGLVGSMQVGFDWAKSGIVSQVLLYGTASVPPVKGLHAAIFSAKTKRELREIQTEQINAAIKRIMEG